MKVLYSMTMLMMMLTTPFVTCHPDLYHLNSMKLLGETLHRSEILFRVGTTKSESSRRKGRRYVRVRDRIGRLGKFFRSPRRRMLLIVT